MFTWSIWAGLHYYYTLVYKHLSIDYYWLHTRCVMNNYQWQRNLGCILEPIIHKLSHVQTYRLVGIIIDDKLTFSCHILSSTKKAYKQSIIMSHCILSKHPHLLKSAFTSYVRPIMEYASPVWSHFTKDIDALERVQRRFTKSFSNIQSLPYSARLTRIDLDVRRNHIDLITYFRLIYGLTHLDYTSFFSPRLNSVTRGHPYTLIKPPVRLNTSKFSFFFSQRRPLEQSAS